VKNGTKQQWEPRPYAIWNVSLPFESADDYHKLGGVAYDPSTGRIYLAQGCVTAGCGPIIHAFKVDIAILPPADDLPPSAPTALNIK
jgi:hypothetical protein